MKKILLLVLFFGSFACKAVPSGVPANQPATLPTATQPATFPTATATEPSLREYKLEEAKRPFEFGEAYNFLLVHRGDEVVESLLATAFTHADAWMDVAEVNTSLSVWDELSLSAQKSVLEGVGDKYVVLDLEDEANDAATIAFMTSFIGDHPNASVIVIFQDQDPEGLTIWTVSPVLIEKDIKYILISSSDSE